MATIFICYRKKDSRGDARLLRDRLVSKFGKEEVFLDTSSISPGTSWNTKLEDELSTCKVFLAVIGPRWRVATSNSSDDIVVKELATAFQKKIVVIPVLVGGSNPPEPKNLPEEIKQLSDRQAFSLNERSDDVYEADISRLISTIQNLIIEPESGPDDLKHGSFYFTRRIILFVHPDELMEGIPSSAEVFPGAYSLEIFGLRSQRNDGRPWVWGEIQKAIRSDFRGNPDWIAELSENVVRASKMQSLPPTQNSIEGHDQALYLPVINYTKLCEDGRLEIEILFVNLSKLRMGETNKKRIQQ